MAADPKGRYSRPAEPKRHKRLRHKRLSQNGLSQNGYVRDGKGTFLALDWAKAFDSISPEAMTRALLRFGCPSKLVEIVTEIYRNRTFEVHDNGHCFNKEKATLWDLSGLPVITISVYHRHDCVIIRC